MTKIRTICVYCGSQNGKNAKIVDDASLLGEILVKHGIGLVYGGGTSGVMGAVASAVHSNGGTVTGIIPRFLLESEAAKEPERWCTEVVVTDSMHQRKHEMFERSDAFIALPGGIGTLEELAEIMTWAQLGRHKKPIAILNTEHFWQPLIDLYDHMNDAGFIHASSLIQLETFNTPADFELFLEDS